jgi:hypothetical protein
MNEAENGGMGEPEERRKREVETVEEAKNGRIGEREKW